MKLHEEYIRRHKLSVPLIQYDQNSKILLRSHNPRNWRVVSFEWQPDFGHPGFWRCSLIEPVHASYGREKNWRQLFRPQKIYWDEYESFVKKLASDFSGWKVTQCVKDRELFCWEVLLYTCDNWLSQSEIGKNRGFLNCVVNSIDPDLSLEDRWGYFQEALSLMDDNSVSEFFSYNICNHLGSGSSWFAELIDNGSKELFARAG